LRFPHPTATRRRSDLRANPTGSRGQWLGGADDPEVAQSELRIAAKITYQNGALHETAKGQRSDCREIAAAAVDYLSIARKIVRPPLLKWRFAYMTGCVKIYTDVNYHGECDQSQENYWTAKFVLNIFSHLFR
jgi:hypothetical protein